MKKKEHKYKDIRAKIRRERVPEVFRHLLESYARTTTQHGSGCYGNFKFCPGNWTYTFSRDKMGKHYLKAHDFLNKGGLLGLASRRKDQPAADPIPRYVQGPKAKLITSPPKAKQIQVCSNLGNLVVSYSA